MPDIWKPSVTVAAIIERDGRFLLVEEETSEGVRFNQPAGHLDPHESLEEAVVRETLYRDRTASALRAKPVATAGLHALCRIDPFAHSLEIIERSPGLPAAAIAGFLKSANIQPL